MAPLSPEHPNFKELKRHPELYISGGDVTFLVGGILLRVHRYFFERESREFREKVLPAPEGKSPHGYTDSTAITIDVPLENFCKFVGVFYNPKYTKYDYTISDWTRVLALAHEWGFAEVKNLAIRELQKHDYDTPEFGLVTRIALYEAHAVEADILVPMYAALCTRAESLTDEEAEELGMRTVVRVCRTREKLHKEKERGNLEKGDVYRMVGEVFGIDVPAVSADVKDASSSSKKKKNNK